MKSSRFELLSSDEIEKIHGLSMEVLSETGIKVNVKKMREMLRENGCGIDEESRIVTFPREVIERCLKTVPREFTLCGPAGEKEWTVNPEAQMFCGLSTAINMYDLETGDYRPTVIQDVVDHIVLMDHCDNIVANQMDLWPGDIPMQTIHTDTMRAWAKNCTKPYSLGAYGVMATRDMMNMLSIIMGGRENMKKHALTGIVSIQSPLSTAQIQIEGLMVFAEWGQPVICSPEAMAGTTAPVSLAGLLVQHNAEILAHIIMAQVVNPGTPVLYGSVSTIAEMRRGTVALGAVETGMISAASAQLAHFYDIPIRAVAGATESKTMDLQCGMERQRSIMLAALGGVNYITCVGTLESTTAAAHELTVIDNEIIGAVMRAVRGIEVNDLNLAADIIRKVGPDGNYLMEEHTQMNFRKEHYIPGTASLEKRDIWEKDGMKNMTDRAAGRARKILAEHSENEIDPKLEAELDAYCKMVAERDISEFYNAEWES